MLKTKNLSIFFQIYNKNSHIGLVSGGDFWLEVYVKGKIDCIIINLNIFITIIISIMSAPKRAIYLCISGVEGVGKTSTSDLLNKYLTSQGYKVLLTKEPGTSHLPVTISLRRLMLDAQYQNNLSKVKSHIASILELREDELTEVAKELLNLILKEESECITVKAREYLSQSIRSIHMERLIYPRSWIM